MAAGQKLQHAVPSGCWFGAYPEPGSAFSLVGCTVEAGVRRTFDFLAKAAVGSRLAFTYVCEDFIDGTAYNGLENLYKRMVARYQVWHFGMAPKRVADFLQGYSWRELEHLGRDELSERGGLTAVTKGSLLDLKTL